MDMSNPYQSQDYSRNEGYQNKVGYPQQHYQPQQQPAPIPRQQYYIGSDAPPGSTMAASPGQRPQPAQHYNDSRQDPYYHSGQPAPISPNPRHSANAASQMSYQSRQEGGNVAYAGNSSYSSSQGYSQQQQQHGAKHMNTQESWLGQPKQKYDSLLKFIIIGDEGVGKTCLLLQFTNEKYRKNHVITVGVEFGQKIVDMENQKVKLQIWDTAGQDRFRCIVRGYFRGAAACLLVYDITQRDTFNHVQDWINELYEQTGTNLAITLVGNKCDMEDRRQIAYDEGHELAQRNNMNFIETSAVTGQFVVDAFLETARIVVKNNPQQLQLKDNGRASNSTRDLTDQRDNVIRLGSGHMGGNDSDQHQQGRSQSGEGDCCA